MRPILIIDDDSASCRMLALHFRASGRSVETANDVESGLDAAQREQPCVIILDIRMPGRSGLEGLPDFKQVAPDAPVIMITAFHDMQTTIEAMQSGAAEYIHKPINIDELDEAVERLLDNPGDEELFDATEKGRSLGMVGRSRAMKEVFKNIGMVAKSPATVLITGESGTGKELVARAIHRAGERPDGPFVVVNCAALVESLLESDMFGHEKGAFTGAHGRQVGKFALAEGGTIFLDEIGELSSAIQAKLLRVLQYKEFMPIGATRSQISSARIIAATNLDLEEAVAAGRFREDLFYRLQVVNIHLPPLRERKEDLLDLVSVLLARINTELARNTSQVSREVMDCFANYSWPGNVRELENLLLKTVALSSGDTITLEQLPPNLHCQPHEQMAVNRSGGEELVSLAEMEKRHIRKVLAAVSGHRGKACKILDISRPKLRRMMREYGVEPDEPES